MIYLARVLFLIALSGALLPAVSSAVTPWSWDGQAWADNRPFMSRITPEVKANLQAILAGGIGNNRVEGRMGQIGDSITHSSAYFRNTLLDGPFGNQTGHNYAPIRSWLAYSSTQPADPFSFYLDYGKDIPYGNFSGWELWEAVEAGHPPVAVEVGDGVTPGEFSWALIMFGTNDIDDESWVAAVWGTELADFVQDFADLGVIPVLSTIPPEFDHLGDGRVEAANREIIALAHAASIPYVDYYRLILYHQPDTWHGTLIDFDGTHPSAGGGGNDFSQDGLTTTDGYAARTKLTLDVAEKLQAIVFDDGEAEPMFSDDFETGNTAFWSTTLSE